MHEGILNLSQQEIDARKEFVHFSPQDEQVLLGLLPLMQKHVDRIVAQFYQHLLQDAERRSFFDSDEKIKRVKQTQKEYLLDLFRGKYDSAYFERRLRIGRVHQSIGLEPKWYLGSNSNFLGLILPLVAKQYRLRPQKIAQCTMAIIKIMNLDQQVVMDTYIESLLARLTDVTENIRRSLAVLVPSAQHVANQVERVVQIFQEGLHMAQEGEQITTRTLSGLSSQLDKVKQATEQMHNLQEEMGKIETISRSVRELTLQTELLALNAAVEAEHAGQAGRGFAVVADEIRILADESKVALDKVRALIAEIMASVSKAAQVTEESRASVETGTGLAQNTGDAFQHLSEVIHNANENAQQISDHIKQQTEAIFHLQRLVGESHD